MAWLQLLWLISALFPFHASAGRPTCHSLPTSLLSVSNILPLRIPSDFLPISNPTVRSCLRAIAVTFPDLTSFVTCLSAHILVHATHRDSSGLSSWLRRYHLSISFRCLQERLSTCLSSLHSSGVSIMLLHIITFSLRNVAHLSHNTSNFSKSLQV